MKLVADDKLIGMDILPAQIVAQVEAAEDEAAADLEERPIEPGTGPWVLTVTTGGYGKRVPISQFRLQNRAGKGIMATKFRGDDTLTALQVVSTDRDELMLVTNRGIIIRQCVAAISVQSRLATGVRVQRLDSDDAIAAVALVSASIRGRRLSGTRRGCS